MNDETQGIPGMPTMNAPAPVQPAPELQAEDTGPNLDAPTHDESVIQKPIIENPEADLDSNVDIPVVSSKGIKVVSTRDGFFNQQRLKSGTKFVVPKFEDLGQWMKCEDPVIEKKRIEFYKNKKAIQ